MRSFTPLPADYVILPPNSATQQTALVVSNKVYKKLMKLSRSKAHGPDGIPGWVLKENADLLAVQIADILNSSYREGRLPPLWKEADVGPVPKQRPVQDINKHLRPISLTPILSKIAEEYVVDTCQAIDRPIAIWNGAQIQHHACINQYDSLLVEVNRWKWIDYESCTL